MITLMTKVISNATFSLCREFPLPIPAEECVCTYVCGQADACALISVLLTDGLKYLLIQTLPVVKRIWIHCPVLQLNLNFSNKLS